MACNPLIIWRPIPAGSRFIPKTSGDDSVYDVVVFVTKNGQALEKLRHAEIAAGTAEVPFVEGDQFVFDVALTLMNKPANSITLDLQVVDTNGAAVSVADGTGGQRPASCSSAFDDPAQSPIMIKVIAVA
ncbi:MAG: hypothetical protein M3P06_02985 [Acidobacteriota bacterium]|nr:hypothetical protein [Acidobacteriota bacterium]